MLRSNFLWPKRSAVEAYYCGSLLIRMLEFVSRRTFNMGCGPAQPPSFFHHHHHNLSKVTGWLFTIPVWSPHHDDYIYYRLLTFNVAAKDGMVSVWSKQIPFILIPLNEVIRLLTFSVSSIAFLCNWSNNSYVLITRHMMHSSRGLHRSFYCNVLHRNIR